MGIVTCDRLGEGEIAFLVCVEANRLEPQARLLCESLRTFGGYYRQAPILAVSPRPHLALGPEARTHLDELGVTYVVEPLNDTGSPYGTINRIVAGAWAEAFSSRPYLVLLDTDTVFVGEPSFVRADVGVRPVDVKGSASSGIGDPQDAYWARLCRLGGIDLSRLPMISTTIDNLPIRASYNGGFTVVRRDPRHPPEDAGYFLCVSLGKPAPAGRHEARRPGLHRFRRARRERMVGLQPGRVEHRDMVRDVRRLHL